MNNLELITKTKTKPSPFSPPYTQKYTQNTQTQQITPTINIQNLSKEIKTIRQLMKISQRDLARKSGYSQTTISRAEKYGWVSMIAIMSIINKGLNKQLIIQ